ncbi:putative membrane protein SpoIIM required for sporulation [Mucilaginibacter frigoritolerans]|uniref:Putative membrane protein SpoIIM required for sporulation n=1 Tax=Mucilaginibacter frigoritolerans TaxID=652788 RepID=A0A562U1Y0_9SPHI|nr:stage II sporulation protein M [Mucilaginibacter frigoritolerans]TWI99829.1 putative membrane protein SpoIIM required for sporulation [Mucilaginibacter frigoritolerans]
MREALFVKQNTQKWKDYENSKDLSPDELAESFISITDDLAYAKTFYPKSNTTKYLNGLAATFHQSIYKNKKEKTNRFITFWSFELPLVFYKHRKPLLYSFLFFAVFSLMGALSAKYDNTFIRLILGDDYVNMTNANIAKGDPFGVYKQGNSFLMFSQIAFNNIAVELTTFIMGIFLSVGTIYQLMNNGIMLGSFEYYLYSKGISAQLMLTVWIHGTLEISAIIIAGGAGLVLGNSLLFPKTYKRIDAVKMGAKDGLKIGIGLIPIFLTAAFFEGFVTRHTEMPLWLSLTILILSFTFIIWYVILYPATLNRKINNNTTTINETAY